MSQPHLTVILPVRDEFSTLNYSLRVLMAVSDDSIGEVLVVVDSFDDTSLQLQRDFEDNVKIRFLVSNYGRGVFNAIRFGVDNSNYENILILVADEILPILQFGKFSEALLNAEFISATRYSKGGKRYGGDKAGRILSYWANKYLYFRNNRKITDATTGIKGFKKKYWNQISRNSQGVGWSCAMQFSFNAIASNLIYIEIPIISVDRPLGGTSTFKLWTWVQGYLSKLIKSEVENF